jgi:prevent-host-death family protein
MALQVSSREFNQDTSGAKKAAEGGPVFITDRGRPSHVLLTFEAYEKLLGVNVIERLGQPPGVEDIEMVITPNKEAAHPATFK